MITASLKNYRQSSRKVRQVADLIKGKTVSQALDVLSVTTKRASHPLAKLIQSALANAKDRGISTDGLIVKECGVNQGYTLKRMMPGARGSGFPISKKTSHVKLVLDMKISNTQKKAPSKIKAMAEISKK